MYIFEKKYSTNEILIYRSHWHFTLRKAGSINNNLCISAHVVCDDKSYHRTIKFDKVADCAERKSVRKVDARGKIDKLWMGCWK